GSRPTSRKVWKVMSSSAVRSRHGSDCSRSQIRAPWPSMFASTRMTGPVCPRRTLRQPRLEPRWAFLRRQVLVSLGKYPAPCPLSVDAALVELLNPAISLGRFLAVVVDILKDGVKFVSCQGGHRLVNKVEIVAAMEVVKDVQDGQPMAFDLRSTTVID